MTQALDTLYKQLKDQLSAVTSSPAQASLEAILFLESVLNISAREVYSDAGRVVSDDEARQLAQLLHERVARRLPVQYLLHKAWFYGLSFYVNPSVLIPRPETELLVEQVLAFATSDTRILDVGTGPGTIALTFSHHLPENHSIHAVDASVEALRVAKLNQRLLKTRVSLHEAGDLFVPIGDAVFDVIVSNPPYVDVHLRETLAPEVAWHEPAMALFAPEGDAYYFYRRLTNEGQAHLAPQGRLLVEVGEGMADAVKQIFEAAGFQQVSIFSDYAGIARIVSGVFSGNCSP